MNAATAPYVGPGVKNGPIALGSFTPLIVAAAHGGSEAVKLLLDAGAKVDAQDVRGMTPLMLAISTDHPDASVVRLLLESKADTNIKDLNGETRSIGPPSSASLRLCRRWASKPTALKSNRRLCACQFGGRPMRSRHREKRCAPATHQRHVFQRGRLRFLPCTESDGNGRRCRARHRSARR
ncbi:MAG: ankyrin repeat domain-containing protein [Acidobacteriota bacterium]|nr:ankyrin repeat domain-containing protein [Acidobacteriota bacterium]